MIKIVMSVFLTNLVIGGIVVIKAAEGVPPVPRVFVTIPPQQYLVERIGGTLVHAEALVRSDQDPHTYEPLPRQMTELARAVLYFRIGLPYESRLLAKISQINPTLMVVNASGLPEEIGTQHDCGHGELDLHSWLSPLLLQQQAAIVCEALQRLDSGNTQTYAQNLKMFLQELDAIHSANQALLAPHKGKAFYVYHPAFGRFGEVYGLRQIAIEREGKPPTPRQLSETIEGARVEKVTTIFVQPQSNRAVVEPIANVLNAKIVTLDPLAYDLLSTLRAIAKQLNESFRNQSK